MDDESEAPPKKSLEDENFNEILPDNERVREKLRLRAEEQAKKIKEEKEERERLQREIENEQLNYEKFAEYVKNGEGNLNEIFRTILSNTSSYELSFPSYRFAASALG